MLDVWYLDDGELDDVVTDFEKLLETAQILGLEINKSTFEFFVMSKNEEFDKQTSDRIGTLVPGIRKIDYHDGTLLGSVIHEYGIDEALDGKILPLEKMCARLKLPIAGP